MFRKFIEDEFKNLHGNNYKYYSAEYVGIVMQQQNEILDFLQQTHPRQFNEWQEKEKKEI